MFSDLGGTRVALFIKQTEGASMSIRKTITLASLVLAVAALSPASTLAKAGGTGRPVKGKFSGTVTLKLLPGLPLTSDATGVASHVGKFSTHLKGNAAFTPDGIVGSGIQKIVAANGDQLTGTFTLESKGLDPTVAHETTVITTVTGGTGRFSDANGTLTAISSVSPISLVGVTLVNSSEGPITGQVSY
jgi:hypothetical protein